MIFLFLITSCMAQDYSQAIGAVRIAAYKQTGLEGYSKQIGRYVIGQLPYSEPLVAGYGLLNSIKHKEIRLKLDNQKRLLIRPNFVSINITF